MGKTIFRELYEANLVVVGDMKRCGSSNPVELAALNDKKKALVEIAKYAKDGRWLRKAESRERCICFLKNNMDYQRTANELKCGLDALYVSVSYASDKLRKRIGENTIQLILDGRVDVAMNQFYALAGIVTMESLVTGSIVNDLPDANFAVCHVSDCMAELNFLHDVSKAVIAERLGMLDMDKLAFLRYIIEKENPHYSALRSLIMNYLKSANADIELLKYELQDEDIFS